MDSGLSNGSTEAFIDNMRLEMVPEPGATGLFGLGLAVLMARRRRGVSKR